MRILMIHGRSQGGKKADDLKATWVDTLKKGFDVDKLKFPTELNIDFPYYGDALDAIVAKANLPTAADVAAKGPGGNTQFENFMRSALLEMKRNADISDAEVESKADPATVQDKGPQNWWWVRAIARAIDEHMTGAATFTIESFLRDVYLYVTNGDVARQIDEIVVAKLSTEPTLVIAHSLGSVVAYNVLRDNPNLQLQKLITVGCPLGMHAISSKLGVIVSLAARDGWYNAFDCRDIVALNPLDATHFGVTPAILNYNGVDNPTDNRHGIVGYLNDPEVARQVAALYT
jgi:hypothetical protein